MSNDSHLTYKTSLLNSIVTYTHISKLDRSTQHVRCSIMFDSCSLQCVYSWLNIRTFSAILAVGDELLVRQVDFVISAVKKKKNISKAQFKASKTSATVTGQTPEVSEPKPSRA